MPSAPRGVLTRSYSDIADLRERGFLDQSSTVWFNAHSARPELWSLTDVSQYVYFFRTDEPGYVRINKDRIRWGRTHDASAGRRGECELDLDLTSGAARHSDGRVVFVVQHREVDCRGRRKSLKLINDSKVVDPPLRNGIAHVRDITVIDLPSYVPPDRPGASKFETEHAMHYGVKHLLSTITKDEAKLLREHLELYSFDLADDILTKLHRSSDPAERIASSFGEELLSRLTAATCYPVERPTRADDLPIEAFGGAMSETSATGSGNAVV